jgi:Transglycosylase-like domain
MPRGVAILALLAGAALAVAGGSYVVEFAAGGPVVHEDPIEASVTPVKRAHRPVVERFRRAPRLLGVRRSQLESIAECESHGDPRAVSSDGTYRGKYQFDKSTWHSNGGQGDPAKAPELEQDLRAAQVMEVRGSSPWPSCS